jgi:hypothetical protein
LTVFSPGALWQFALFLAQGSKEILLFAVAGDSNSYDSSRPLIKHFVAED